MENITLKSLQGSLITLYVNLGSSRLGLTFFNKLSSGCLRYRLPTPQAFFPISTNGIQFSMVSHCPVVDLPSKILDGPPSPPPNQSNFLHFHAVFREIWPNTRSTPMLTPPPHLGNPGSTPADRLP